MGRDATKAAGNPWYQARKKAAEYDDRLCSRESAAEQLGMSVSSLADAELGNTKFMPVDKAVLMADRYNAPWLLNHYCLNECPIGCRHSLSDEVVGIDRVTVKLLKSLKTEKLGDVKDTLLDIAADGKITEDEKPALQEVLAYSDISEVENAGFVTSGADADPVGLAASVAFAQSPRPTAVYIAVQQLSEGAVVAGQTIKDTNAAVAQYAGKKEGLTGCAISFKESARKLSMVLDGPITGVKNTGLFDMLAALIADGYTATIEDAAITDGASFKACPVWSRLKKMDKGDEEQFTVEVNKAGGTAVLYTVAISYPDPDAPATQAAEDNEPANTPDTELETPATTIARALATSGWYVLCTAGVDPAKYEEIAAYMETQEKLFCYTELDCFAAPGTVRKDGEDLVQPSVGNVYFRTLGVYGRETTDQADEDIPPANRYINVAFVAKWLNYESGSETTAFKQLASVYPSKLTSTEMKALADKSLNYFITVGSKNLSMNGKVIGNEWADIIRFRDWLKNDMQLRVVNLFVTRPKVPYTDAGISLVQNQMIASLKSGQDAGGIAESEFDEDGTEIPGYVTSVPLAASLSASEKASRKLTKCKFKARLAGAIHFAELKGSLTYEL